MDHLVWLIDAILHIDRYLKILGTNYGAAVYLVLFLIVFCETGLVITPFLPGDSLLFMAGTLSATGILSLAPTLLIFALAAILGDTVNYHAGKFFGPRAFTSDTRLLFKKENLERATLFYEKWGGAAIVLGRFMPIIRTFVPFTAGIGKMNYFRFLVFNAAGAVAWVGFFTLCGFFFGNIPVVQKNLTLVIYGIVVVSLIPAVVGAVRSKK
jgi:membrane-associated protein